MIPWTPPRSPRAAGIAARAHIAPRLSRWAVALSMAAAPQGLASAPFHDLLNELASALAGRLQPNERVQVSSPDPRLARELGARLAELGISIDSGEASAAVFFTCSETIGDRVCAADVRRGESHAFVAVRWPRRHEVSTGPAPVLQLHPLIATNDPILDVMVTGSRMLSLHPSYVAEYHALAGGWRLRGSQPTVSRAWPRDVRGRMQADDGMLDVFLPGASCRGRIDPLEMKCGETRPWPSVPEHAGIPASRNYFRTPGGHSFYAASELGADAGARWMIAGEDGRFAFLDEGGRQLESAGDTGSDDIARVATSCAPGTHVLLGVPSRTPADSDQLRLAHVVERRVEPVGPPLTLPGLLTALWSAPAGDRATAVVFNGARQHYEAFHVTVACGR